MLIMLKMWGSHRLFPHWTFPFAELYELSCDLLGRLEANNFCQPLPNSEGQASHLFLWGQLSSL